MFIIQANKASFDICRVTGESGIVTIAHIISEFYLSCGLSLNKWEMCNVKILKPSNYKAISLTEDEKKLLHLWEIFITFVEIFQVFYTCGKTAVTFVGQIQLLRLWEILLHLWELLHQNYLITLVGPTMLPPTISPLMVQITRLAVTIILVMMIGIQYH